MAIYGTQNTPRNADGSYNFWADYYENGIIPNIWKGITGQTGANRNADNTNALNKQIADENLAFQKENLEYQKALQQQIFEREDTSYQRTAKDMLAAGLNPLSMAGTNGSGQVVSTNPLNNGMVYERPDTMNPNEALSAFSSMLSEIDSIRTGKLERDSLQSQIDRQKLENFAFAKKNGIDYNPSGFKNDEYLDKYAKADLGALERSNTTDVEKMLTYAEELLLSGHAEDVADQMSKKYPQLGLVADIVKPDKSDLVRKGVDFGINKVSEYLKKNPEKFQNNKFNFTKSINNNWFNNSSDDILNKISSNKRHRTETQEDFYKRMYRNTQRKRK